ncbi:hypothetical protein GCM10028777_18350 [Angustibacter speluncae]
MDSLPFAMVTANDATRAHLHSARPDAPVVPDAEPRLARTRVRLAAALRTAAERLAVPPRPARTSSPSRFAPSH